MAPSEKKIDEKSWKYLNQLQLVSTTTTSDCFDLQIILYVGRESFVITACRSCGPGKNVFVGEKK